MNPEWKEKVYKEALDLVNKHVGPNVSGVPLHEGLASMPLSAWEEDLPILDLCLRETIRIHLPGAALRRNIHDDLHIGDKVIDKGAFIAYSVADVHLNSNIYSDPEKFDPDRFKVRAEDVKSQTTYPFLGWGAGEPFPRLITSYADTHLIMLLRETSLRRHEICQARDKIDHNSSHFGIRV
jgi:cytochrome P450